MSKRSDRGAGVGHADAGRPVELALDLIDEDPAQPRQADNPGFSARSLSELAESIRQRGVKTPISVRPNPGNPGRYLVNHGARRRRASLLAGRSTIPAFVDTDYNEADQVVENLHRDNLTTREIADYIGRELAKGLKRKQIAENISKSAAFITQHARLLDLPEPLADAFSSGRVRDVTLVNELATAHQKAPIEVTRWLANDAQEITRATVQMLRQFLDQRKEGVIDEVPAATNGRGEPSRDSRRRMRRSSATVVVSHQGRTGKLMLNRRPDLENGAWLQFDDSGSLEEVPLSEVVLLSLAFDAGT